MFVTVNLSITFQQNFNAIHSWCFNYLVSTVPLKLYFVTQVLNMLCCWVEDPNSEAFRLHLPRVYDYLWIAEDGMKMQVST